MCQGVIEYFDKKRGVGKKVINKVVLREDYKENPSNLPELL